MAAPRVTTSTSSFTACSAAGSGGSVYATQSVDVSACSFASGAASVNGGAIASAGTGAGGSAAVVVSGSSFAGCSAGEVRACFMRHPAFPDGCSVRLPQ